MSGRDRWKQSVISRSVDFSETNASRGITNIDAILERIKSGGSSTLDKENVRAYDGPNKPRATMFVG